MVTNKDDVLNLIRKNKQKFNNFGVLRIGIFGSFVRGEQAEDSDVDLMVDFEKEKKTFKNFMNVAEYSEKILGRRVDILTSDSVSPYIFPYINKEIEYVKITN